MQFAYVDEFSHGAVGLAGVKLNRPFEAYGFGYEMWELAYGQYAHDNLPMNGVLCRARHNLCPAAILPDKSHPDR